METLVNQSRNTAEAIQERKEATVDLRVAVKGPDLFSVPDGAVTDVAATNSFVLAQVSKGEQSRLALFNEANNQLYIPEELLSKLSRGYITIKDLEAYAARKGLDSLAIDGSPGDGVIAFSEFCEDFNLSRSEAERFRRVALGQSVGGKLAIKGSTAALQEPFVRDFRLNTDVDERNFIIESGRAVNLIRTVGEDNRPLQPKDWEVRSFEDSAQITSLVVSEDPALENARVTDKGRHIGGLNIAVNLCQGSLTIVDTVQGKRVLSDPADAYAFDPVKKGAILFVGPDMNLCEVDVLQSKKKAITISSRPLPMDGRVSSLKVDPHGNFIGMIVATEDGKKTLCLVERDTLRVAARIEDLGDKFDFNRFGEIYFNDSKGRLRLASSNMDSFSPDGLEEARELQKIRLSALIEHARSAKLPEISVPKPQKVDVQKDADSTDLRASVIKEVKNEITGRFSAAVKAAGTLDEVKTLSRQIEILSSGERFREYPEIFEDIEEAIQDKEYALDTEQLERQMKDFQVKISGRPTVRELAQLNDEWAAITRLRVNMKIRSESVRQSVDETFKELKDLTEKKLGALEQTVEKFLVQSYPDIKRTVEGTIYNKDLHALRGTREFLDFESAISSLGSADARRDWRRKYQGLFKEQERCISRLQDQNETEKMTRLAETLEDLKDVRQGIETELHAITHSTELSRWRKRNPMVIRYRTLALGLAGDLKIRHEKELEETIERRRRELLQVEQSTLVRTSEQVTFGNETFPVAPDSRLIYKPVVKPVADRADKGRLIFRDMTGRQFVPEWEPVPFDMDSDETKRALDATKAAAEEYFSSVRPKVPLFNPRWVINAWTKGVLDQMAQACREQLETGSGIVILEGEAGCGKDVLWKMFSHFTQRGLELIPCNSQTEKEDILYDFDYTPDKGTERIPSKFLEVVQIPYAVTLLGEINTAPTGVTKMLNSAMDEQRIVPVSRGPAVEIDSTVLLAGTMNPQHYLATQKLSQEVLSRATIIQVSYPPFAKEDAAGFYPYEAEMYAKHVPALNDATQEEFYQMWDTVVNQDHSANGERFLTEDRRKLVDHLKRVVAIADGIRKDYHKYHSGDPDAPKCEFVFTLREGVKIASRLKPDSKVAEIVKQVVLPKISDPEEKLRVEAIINQTT